MSQSFKQTTHNFVIQVQKIHPEHNMDDLLEIADNLISEYQEISQLRKSTDELIKRQLDLAEENKNKRIIHWQTAEKSNWIKLHEDYHKNKDNIFRKVNNFCNHYYAFTNFLSDLLFQTFPHQHQRGINNKSFHTMINSLSKKPTHPFYPLVINGLKIVKVNEYRSKIINHRKLQKGDSRILIRKKMDQREVIDLHPITIDTSFEDEFVIPKDAPDDIVIETTSSEKGVVLNTKHILHSMVCESKLNEGDIVHYHPYHLFDYYGHFRKHGRHWHEFARPGNELNQSLFSLSGEVEVTTPELWSAIVILQKFIKKARGLIVNT